MPRFGLRLGVEFPPTLADEGGGSATRLGDFGTLLLAGRDATYLATFIGDTGTLALTGTDSRRKIATLGDTGTLTIAGLDSSIGGQQGDAGVLPIAGVDATYKVATLSDTGTLALAGTDSRYKVAIASDSTNLALVGTDGRTLIKLNADTGTFAIAGTDGEWEDDFVAVYDPVTVTVNASATTSSAFSIPGKVVWITGPVTTSARTVTLQHTPDSGTTWNSTGVTWTTSTSVQTEINSETLAKMSGATGPGLNNFRLSYDSSLSGSTSHVIRSRT